MFIHLEFILTIGFWDAFSRSSDVVSHISIILTIVTLCTTIGIRKSLLAHIEKSDYIEDIDDRIKLLRSYEATIKKDPELCNEALLNYIYDQLDDILISYETILKKKIISQIKTLEKYIDENKKKTLNKDVKRECQKQLHSICTRLEKEKKVL